MNGFDARYLSHEIYLPLVARKLNNYHYTKFFEDKGLLGAQQCDDLRFPYCYVRCIDGEYYDNSLQQISKQRAVDICLNQEVLVWKPGKNSSGGHNVQMIVLTGQNNNEKTKEVQSLFETKFRDFVIQRQLEQHEQISRFNETSINTFRITTLYLNGKASLQSCCMRMGGLGSFVDNVGSGGIMVGVKPDGKMNEYGLGYECIKRDSANGVKFKDVSFSFLPSVIEFLLEHHKKSFPLCKLIGWDVCIDKEMKPIVIEINSSQPGIFYEQIVSGPIFVDRTDEVIKYVKTKKFVYNRSIISY